MKGTRTANKEKANFNKMMICFENANRNYNKNRFENMTVTPAKKATA